MPASAPFGVLGPPDKVPSAPPVVTRVQELPFGELTWENFERLSYRLVALEGDVEHCARYGQQGDAQEGIDVYARQADGRYHCLQAKRHSKFSPGKLRNAVDLFLSGSWASDAVRFTIAVRASLRSPAMQKEIERQAARLKAKGIAFTALDGERLTGRLRAHPVLVDDFFGRPWVEAVIGREAAQRLGARLDGGDFARVRAQLAKVYRSNFQFVDPATFSSMSETDVRPELTLLERFLKPDILVRESAPLLERTEVAEPQRESKVQGSTPTALARAADPNRSSEGSTSTRIRRLAITEWFGDGERLLVLGDAGCGKSTLLRVIALDLLHQNQHFPELATRWGEHIPIYVPFARWASQVLRDGNPIGIKEIVRRSLQEHLTAPIVDLLDQAIDERRVLLLIDGLDEWSNEQAARATLGSLVTTVDAHGVPVVVSGRPRGLSKIWAVPAHWKRGTVAPLSAPQQAAIAGRWFARYATTVQDGSAASEASMRTQRFMADLGRDANLGTLAAVPLLLVGLVALALRGQILPRTRTDVYDQLVRILLEDHPVSRATASGDTQARFRHATDSAQTRAAIARLAYAARERLSGAGMPVANAREILCSYLASAEGFGLDRPEAAAVASEILLVNSETQGLLVEKAPGEVGFVHASFEEFLAAEHIAGWPFPEIEAFVRSHAREARWRNVVVNLLGRIERRDEFDRLVAITEAVDADEVGRFQRDALLGDVAFAALTRAPATSKRLALATMRRVETEDWLPVRREALASVLKGLADPTIKAEIERRLGRWLPARLLYRPSLIRAFSGWKPTAQLEDVLFQAMHDEQRGVQRAAAAAYAKIFSASHGACERLLEALARSRDLPASTALLESLALGWARAPEAAPLFEESCRSHAAELRLVGILGLAENGVKTHESRDAVLRGQHHWSEVSYEYRDLAVAMLMKYWPGDDALIRSALERVSHHANSVWEHDSATGYLLESPVDRADVRAWIKSQLKSEHPFVTLGRNPRLWSQVARFAAADPDIRAAANAYWCAPQSRIIGMHMIHGYVAQIADPPVAAALTSVLREDVPAMQRHWAVKALLAAWGRDHPDVQPAIDALAEDSDEALHDLVAFIPEIMRDKAAARERLLRIGMRPNVRRNLLAVGFESCGCDAADEQATATLIERPDQLSGPFAPWEVLLRAFKTHPKVRALAQEHIRKADGPLAAIAAAYPDDPEFTSLLFDAAVPLPVDLRTQIVEFAANAGAGTALELVLGQGMDEADPELRTRMVIAHHRNLPLEARESAREALLTKAVDIGPDFESGRAAALAGLTAMGVLDALVEIQEHGKPLLLQCGGMLSEIPSLDRLVCERFEDFTVVFGDSLRERFHSYGDHGLPEILSVAPSASTAARTAFLSLAERGEMPRSARALRALAAERPRSDLLLARCWDTLGSRDDRNDFAMLNAEVALILREQFPSDPAVRKRLAERFLARQTAATAVALAVFAPDSKELPSPANLDALGRQFADWTVAVHVAASRADASSFCELLERMVTRTWRSQFDAQRITNIGVDDRLQRDQELEALLSARIDKQVDPSISGSFARYLSAAGKLTAQARARTLDLLDALRKDQRLPAAGYDAIADDWRAARATLLDAVSAGIELG